MEPCPYIEVMTNTQTAKHQIVCPNCAAINRVPTNKSVSKAKCGKCQSKLMDGQPAELTDANFAKFIAKTSIPVVVDFWAPWCGPCKMMGPEFSKAATQMEPAVRFVKLNTQDHQNTATKYKIQGIPAMILFKSGQPVAHLAGARRVDEIKSWIESNM